MTNKECFELFLTCAGKSTRTINNYSSCLAGMVSDKINQYIEPIGSLYDITDVEHLKRLLDAVLKVNDFAEQDKRGGNMYSAAFNMYISYSEFLQKYEQPKQQRNMANAVSSRQIIFYGAPGTGKSNKIEELTNDDNRIRTTFHPDSDYSTFVGAYKPTMENEDKYLERLCDIDYLASIFKNDYNKADKKTVAVDTFAIKYAEYLDGKYGKVSLRELCERAEIPTGYEVAIRDTVNAYHACIKQQMKPNQIVYSFVPQAFLKAYVEAWKRKNAGDESPYYLVIEEINRGNCAQIFGDLFQLLDRNEEGSSRYAIVPDDDIRRHLEKELANCTNLPEKIMKGEEMRLPSNLYIWATMNTSDQSLFPIDSAFKRRWDWEYMPIENGGKGFVIDIAGTQYDWWNFISNINEKIDRITGSEDKKLGYWFAKPATGGRKIDCQQFVSKVLFYLWNDVYKDYADSKDSIFRADNNGQSIKTPFTTFFGSGREERIKAFMAYNHIEPISENAEDDYSSDADFIEGSAEENSTANKDTTKYTFNGDDNKGKGFSKGGVVRKAIEYYCSIHPTHTAKEVMDTWLSLGVKIPNLVETVEVYAARTQGSIDSRLTEKSKIIELPNGESLHISNQLNLERIKDFISKVNASDWSINIQIFG